MTTEAKPGDFSKILCRGCAHITNHKVVGLHNTACSSEDFQSNTEHTLLCCQGCDSVTYRELTHSSEDHDEGPTETLYPPRGSRRLPRDFDYLPYGSPLESVYRQTIAAFNESLVTLAAAGIRMLVEGACAERGIKKGPVKDVKTGKFKQKKGHVLLSGSLEGKINGLAQKGFIGEQQADSLHQLRFLGNDAAHELDQPAREDLKLALDIVEQMFDQVYEQSGKAALLKHRKKPGVHKKSP